jgi:hypothetical protein
MIKTTFNLLLEIIENYDNNHIIYAKSFTPNLLDEVLIDDDVYEIKNNIDGFEYLFGMNQLKSILRNLDYQRPNNNDLNLCLAAINYYINNDAYITL